MVGNVKHDFGETRRSRNTVAGYRVAVSESQMAAGDPLAQFHPVRFIPLHRCTLLHLA